MPKKGWKPKNRKKGYRRFLCAPRKNHNKQTQVKHDTNYATNNAEESGFHGFDLPPMVKQVIKYDVLKFAFS